MHPLTTRTCATQSGHIASCRETTSTGCAAARGRCGTGIAVAVTIAHKPRKNAPSHLRTIPSSLLSSCPCSYYRFVGLLLFTSTSPMPRSSVVALVLLCCIALAQARIPRNEAERLQDEERLRRQEESDAHTYYVLLKPSSEGNSKARSEELALDFHKRLGGDPHVAVVAASKVRPSTVCPAASSSGYAFQNPALRCVPRGPRQTAPESRDVGKPEHGPRHLLFSLAHQHAYVRVRACVRACVRAPSPSASACQENLARSDPSRACRTSWS